jgi:spermidine synthase
MTETIVKGSNTNRMVSAILCGVFFFSGAAALMFETLWFRQAGLTFGNSVWASTVVLASFMGGMALGNGLAAALGRRVRRPIRLFAFTQILIAVSGVVLVYLFPVLTEVLKPLFRLFLDRPALLNALRLFICFALMTVPATAMGMTLPLLVKALTSSSPTFGAVLGRLYGWNTLGAVAGALIAETVCIGWCGVRGTGLVAGAVNLVCAAAALWIAGNQYGLASEFDRESPKRRLGSALSAQVWRLLAAGFLSGGILLALEVIWFRFLILFFNAYSVAFAIMLAVVLAGIGVGGMLASWWFRVQPQAHRHLTAMALLSGTVSIAVYALFPRSIVESVGPSPYESTFMVALSVPLIFPVSLLSGILFTLIGQSAYDRIGESTETAGLLTMLNTAGATLGSVLAGLVLLPSLGMEKSLFVLSVCYGGVALCAAKKSDFAPLGRPTALNVTAVLLFLASIVCFPFGAMESHILDVGRATFGDKTGWKPVAVREGITETSQYWQKHLSGQLLWTRLVTNNHPMSGTANQARRYMNYFVYWPLAVHPNPKSALLICFGVGSTAKALTDAKGLQSIDVVDISSDILANSAVIFPDKKDNPLHDPRVNVHVEDGRFFLQTTPRKFDIITAEPPPPLAAGVVNLYSEEYFRLIYDRLQEGGVVTYWLPIWQIPWSAGQSIVKAFANVFQDCSVWTGTGFDWMLVGTRNPTGPVTEEQFRALWQDPVFGPQLRLYGFEQPEQFAATFIMDGNDMRKWTKDSLPLTDDYPKRMFGKPSDWYEYTVRDLEDVMAPDVSRGRFRDSSAMARLWPASLREKSLEYFRFQRIINAGFVLPFVTDAVRNVESLHMIQTQTSWRYPVLLILGGPEFLDVDRVLSSFGAQITDRSPDTLFGLGVGALADRDYAKAAAYFADAQQSGKMPFLPYYRVYALCMAGLIDDARKVADENKDTFAGENGSLFRKWLVETFGW